MARFDYESSIRRIISEISPNSEIQYLSWGVREGVAFVWSKEDDGQIHILVYNPDGVIFQKELDAIHSLFEENQYYLFERKTINNEFLTNEEEVVYVDGSERNFDLKQKELLSKIRTVAENNNIHFRATLGIIGGQAWLNFRQVDDNDYKIQISTSGSFDSYKKIRDDCCTALLSVGAVLADESDYGNRTLGFQKELTFMDRTKYDKMNEKVDENMHPTTNNIGTQVFGNIDTGGGNLNTGNAKKIDNSTTHSSEDTKWFQKEVVKMILSFIGGVGATLVSQWLLSLLN